MDMRRLWAMFVLLAGTSAAAGDPLNDLVVAGDISGLKQVLDGGANVESRARDGATPLINAALARQPAIVGLLLSKGADIGARNSGGFTALHAAAFSGSLDAAKMLVDKGAPLEDAANKSGVTPLMVAGEENHVDVAEFLIARGAAVDHPEIHGYLPITRALWKGNSDIVRLFKRHGATCPSAAVLGDETWHRTCLEIGE